MPSENPTKLARREADLITAIEEMLPDFARACRAPDPAGMHEGRERVLVAIRDCRADSGAD